MQEQEIVDMVCEARADEAIEVVANQYGLTDDELRSMLNDPSGLFDEHPAYESYYATLDRFVEETKHA